MVLACRAMCLSLKSCATVYVASQLCPGKH